MGILRKMTSMATLNAVHFTDANHRTEVNTKKTRKAVERGNRQRGGLAAQALVQQQQMAAAQAEQARQAARHAEQLRQQAWVTQQQLAAQQQGQLPAPPAGPTAIADQLAQVADLHGQGLLTDAEFATAKAQVLGGAPALPQAALDPNRDIAVWHPDPL